MTKIQHYAEINSDVFAKLKFYLKEYKTSMNCAFHVSPKLFFFLKKSSPVESPNRNLGRVLIRLCGVSAYLTTLL